MSRYEIYAEGEPLSKADTFARARSEAVGLVHHGEANRTAVFGLHQNTGARLELLLTVWMEGGELRESVSSGASAWERREPQ